MRVLYFSTQFGPHDRRFLASLAGTRHEVHFLRLVGRSGSSHVEDMPAGVHEVKWRGTRDPLRWWALPALIRDFRDVIRGVRPDLVHAGPIQTCAFIAVLSGFRPILTMSWGFDLMQDADHDAFSRWVTRYTLQRSSFFVSDAMVTRNRAISFGMPADRTAVFPWGVDLRRFRPGSRRERRETGSATGKGRRSEPRVSVTRGRIVLLCNRSWEERYGVDVLARAFVIVAPRLPGASLILMGAGSQAATIRRILEQGVPPGRVQFAGRIAQAEIHKWYRKADLYISPSHVDGSSVSLMEALACGTPALVSDIPANLEWIRDGVNGWLFRDGDHEHLAERIVWIADQGAEMRRVAAAARRTAEKQADWRQNFNVLLDAYVRAAAQDGRP